MHCDERAEGKEQLDRPDVGVGPADDLTGLGAVPEIERELGEPLVHQVAEILLDAQRRSEEPKPVGEAENEPDDGEPEQAGDERCGGVAVSDRVDPATQHDRHRHGGGHADQSDQDRPSGAKGWEDRSHGNASQDVNDFDQGRSRRRRGASPEGGDDSTADYGGAES